MAVTVFALRESARAGDVVEKCGIIVVSQSQCNARWLCATLISSGSYEVLWLLARVCTAKNLARPSGDMKMYKTFVVL